MREGTVLLCCYLTTLAFTAVHGQQSTLRKIQVVFRHGIRYPVRLKWNDSCVRWYNDYQIGNLTQKGKDQMTLLGNALRSRYDGFIGPDANAVEAIYSDCHRDLESAELVSQGLFQDFNTSAVRTVKLDWEAEGPLITKRGLLIEWINALTFKDKYKDLCERLDGLEDVECKNLVDVFFIADQMVCEITEGCALPAWFDRETEQQLQKVFSDMVEDIKLCTSRSYVKANSDGLLAVMNAVFAGSHKKVYLYALHDMNVEMLKTRMGAPFSGYPSFGSVLIFELHVLGDGSPVVRVFYDNTLDYTGLHRLKIAGCHMDCPLAEYLRITSGRSLCYRLDPRCTRTAPVYSLPAGIHTWEREY